MRAAACLALCLTAAAARAELPANSLGDGRLGALQVDDERPINRYYALRNDAAAGSLTVQLADAGTFAAGELIMVLQMTGVIGTVDSGSPDPVDLTLQPAGTFELVRVEQSTGATLTLKEPLAHGYGPGTQVLSVPEYTSVTVGAAGRITAAPWNGATGGVVALLAKGPIVVEGLIDATGAGARGGTVVAGPSMFGCTGLDQPAPAGAQKGEGITRQLAAGITGRGNLANAGGGGDCDNSGGGGGANAGRGGKGGRTYGPNDGSRDVGGLGGAPLVFSPLKRLALGGGGGAGHSNGSVLGHGAPGGGIIWLRAASLSGTGELKANGVKGGNAPNDGAGGGGAGGTISVQLTGTARCGKLSARGGEGGDQLDMMNPAHAPGGGGGGGHVLLQPASTMCPIDVANGVAGVTDDPVAPFGLHNGAEPTTSPAPGYKGVSEQLADPLPVSMTPGPAPLPRVYSVGCGCGGGAGLPALVALLAAARRFSRSARRGASASAP